MLIEAGTTKARRLTRALPVLAFIVSFFFLSCLNLATQAAQSSQQQAQATAQPQAKRPPQTPEEKEMAKLREQIRELQQKYFELRAKIGRASCRERV